MKCHKEKYSWIKMYNHTVVQLKAIAIERGIRVYYNVRKAEFIHALAAARLVVQKSNIFDELIANDPSPVLQPTPWRPSNITTKVKQNTKKKSLLRAFKRLQILVNGCWITYHQNQNWLTKCLSILKTKLEKCTKGDILCSNQHSPSLLWRFCDSASNKRIKWIRPRIVSV